MEQATMEKIKNIYAKRDENRRKIGERIKHIRENILHMTQPKFYELICPNNVVAQSTKGTTISSWEHATLKNDNKTAVTFPNLEQLCAIATAGGVSLEWLLMGDENKTPQDKPTWRDLSRSLMKASFLNDTNITMNDDKKAYEDGEDVACTISFRLQKCVDYPFDHPRDLLPTTIGKNVYEFLQVLSTITNDKGPVSKRYGNDILNDALNNVPNTPIQEKDDSMPF